MNRSFQASCSGEERSRGPLDLTSPRRGLDERLRAPSKKERRLARQRAEATARRRRARQKRLWAAVAALLSLALVGGIVALGLASHSSPPRTSSGTNAGLVSDQSTATGAGVRAVFAQPHLTDGKPLTFFLGGQFCPFCGAIRWPLVEALSRFGTFSGLGQMHSRPGEDGFQSVATYDFVNAHYESPYITLRTVEAADANGNTLQSPDAEESSLVNQFDPQGSIPFLFVGGRYVASLTYSPGLLQGLSFQQILAEANSPHPGPLGTAIHREADGLTAAICSTDGAQPAAVCSSPAIRSLMKTLG